MALIGVSGRLELGVTRFVVLICCWEAGHPFGGVPLFLCPGRESNPSTSSDRWRNHSQPDAGRRGPGVGDEAALGVRLPTPAKNPILGALAHDWTLTRKRLMILNIDTSDKEFVVTQAPQPKVDQNGEPRTDKNGLPLWQTQMVVTDDSGGEIIRVNTSGEPPKFHVGDPVLPQGLVVVFWASNGRSGTSFRADAIIEDRG